MHQRLNQEDSPFTVDRIIELTLFLKGIALSFYMEKNCW